jgi:GT2 family glycosyltransferase
MITIAITTYNRPKFLEECLKSALTQDFSSEWKILVSDNSDKNFKIEGPETLKILLNNEKVRYVKNKLKGLNQNFNNCIFECDTKYIFFLNDDDIVYSNFLKDASQVIDEKKDGISFLFVLEPFGEQKNSNLFNFKFEIFFRKLINNIKKKNSKSIVMKKIVRVANSEDLFYGNPFLGMSHVHDVEKIKKIGGFREEIPVASDHDLLIRMNQIGKLYLCKKIIGGYRYHSGNHESSPSTLINFYKNGPLIRLGLVSENNSKLKKTFFTLANSTLYELQRKMYILSYIKLKKHKYKIRFYQLFSILFVRMYLRLLVKIFNYIK